MEQKKWPYLFYTPEKAAKLQGMNSGISRNTYKIQLKSTGETRENILKEVDMHREPEERNRLPIKVYNQYKKPFNQEQREESRYKPKNDNRIESELAESNKKVENLNKTLKVRDDVIYKLNLDLERKDNHIKELKDQLDNKEETIYSIELRLHGLEQAKAKDLRIIPLREEYEKRFRMLSRMQEEPRLLKSEELSYKKNVEDKKKLHNIYSEGPRRKSNLLQKYEPEKFGLYKETKGTMTEDGGFKKQPSEQRTDAPRKVEDEINELKSTIEKLNEEKIEFNQKLRLEIQTPLNELVKKLNEARTNLKNLKNEIERHYTKQQKKLFEQIESLKDHISKLKKLNEEQQAEIEELEKTNKDLNDKILEPNAVNIKEEEEIIVKKLKENIDLMIEDANNKLKLLNEDSFTFKDKVQKTIEALSDTELEIELEGYNVLLEETKTTISNIILNNSNETESVEKLLRTMNELRRINFTFDAITCKEIKIFHKCLDLNNKNLNTIKQLRKNVIIQNRTSKVDEEDTKEEIRKAKEIIKCLLINKENEIVVYKRDLEAIQFAATDYFDHLNENVKKKLCVLEARINSLIHKLT